MSLLDFKGEPDTPSLQEQCQHAYGARGLLCNKLCRAWRIGALLIAEPMP